MNGWWQWGGSGLGFEGEQGLITQSGGLPGAQGATWTSSSRL